MIVVAALYEFKKFPDFNDHKESLVRFCKSHGIKGTLILAEEGINGTVSGTRNAIDNLSLKLKEMGFSNLEYKESFFDQHPFARLKIKVKKEIVTLGEEGADPTLLVGTHLNSREWNDLISRPDVITIDARNDYEVLIGTFKKAINPKTKTFKDLTSYTKEKLQAFKEKPVAMFCTGGIRCERSTAYLKSQGFKEVYHLKGGILKYLEDTPQEESIWEGECFVFDQRVTVKHGLEVGTYSSCRGCRMPINEQDKLSPHYKEGIYCHHCHDSYDQDHYGRMAERQRQVELAAKRGEKHIGDTRHHPKEQQLI